jgi:hypothetical protein
MTSPDNETIKSAVEKAAHSPDFTEQEINALKAVADAWRGLEAFGRVAVVLQKIAIYAGWLVAGYFAVKFALDEWVRSVR